jgi:hypothetical protein
VKTRTLIILAAACGVAILVAGVAFFWRIIAHRDELTVPEIRAPGQSQQIGPVTATVDSSSDVDDVVLVRVSLRSGQARPDAASGWSLVVAGDTSARAPVAVPDGSGPACTGMAVAAGQPVECVLAFPAGRGERYVAFAVGPVQRQWKL